jgi:hypothetical protein
LFYDKRRRPSLYQSLLQDSRHFEFLLSVDTDLAAEARRAVFRPA